MLATGSLLGATTAARVGVGCLGVAVGRGPSLIRLGTMASLGTADARSAEMGFRDEIIGLVREAAEVSWREWRRGVDDLDQLTRSGARGAPRRRHRVIP